MKIRAIVLDDEKIIRKMFSCIPSNRGYEVLSFEDPSKCPLYTGQLPLT